jgi:hypothetical protein
MNADLLAGLEDDGDIQRAGGEPSTHAFTLDDLAAMLDAVRDRASVSRVRAFADIAGEHGTQPGANERTAELRAAIETTLDRHGFTPGAHAGGDGEAPSADLITDERAVVQSLFDASIAQLAGCLRNGRHEQTHPRDDADRFGGEPLYVRAIRELLDAWDDYWSRTEDELEGDA